MLGEEEYLNPEKYQLCAWNHNRPGNIIKEIVLLNRTHRANPVLCSHLGMMFQLVLGNRILFFSRLTPSVLPVWLETVSAELTKPADTLSSDRFEDNTVFVAVNFDPHHVYESDIELPLWRRGLLDHGTSMVENLVNG